MTLGELYDAVAYLGFETALDEEVLRRSFYAVLPRAIGTVERLAPRVRRVSLSHIAPCDCLRFEGPRRLSDGEVLTLELAPSAQLVSLSLFGEGSVLLSSSSEERTETFSSVGETVLSLPTRGATRLSICAVRGVTVGAIGAYGALLPRFCRLLVSRPLP